MDKYTGKRLDGRYEIHELIGVGGMALVYRAYDQIDDRTVAIKILKDEFLGNEDFIRRFKNESKAIAVLSHPNIVKVYDVSFGDQIQYIVMEYIDGITLREYLDQQKEIKWKEAIHFTVQILRALQHAHEKGIIHRDIKPQNIMLLQDGTIKVTDFGIARFSRNETRTMTDKAIGSVHYIAPEQARGDLTDEKADIYSVGVMLYEMITGQLPFEADNAVSVAIMQLQADPRLPKDINPAIPDGLEEITLKAMQKDPSQRYQSAAEMLRDIEQFRRNPSISFQYKYFIDEKPTKYVDAINTVRGTEVANYNDNYAYEEEYSRGKKKKKSTAALIVSGVLTAFLLTAVVFGIMALTRSCSTQEVADVDLPQFIGQKLSDIQSNEKYKDFQFKIEYSEDSSKDSGIVLDQNPKGNKKVKANAEITLTVNGESQTVTIPTVKGLTQAEAEDKLKKINLKYEVYQVEDDQTAAGYVKDVVPAEGTEVVLSGSVIKLYVSKGPSSTEVGVPSVIGKNLDAAKTDILAVGLTVDTEINYVDDSDKAEGVVIETSPLPGVKVAKGTPVKISVSSGKKSEKSIDIYVQLPSQVTHDIALKAYVDGTLYSEKTVNPSYNSVYQMSFKGTSGQKTLIIQLDGQKYNTFLLDFDTGIPRQTDSYTYQEPGESSASGITRAP
ncbi:Stk1 family PASTA domain-containing Ser/Thr kinase [Clostridium merdae]|uniref:Stk1 family PASTA domain-containing Ser/Thr kinase n=1 Tax=Clostridium merdae TaxID=1958780 RepID=UPI000A270140|nr:Stk1 family PASTA domain-containing Ser/Thr kinase [Clostridium merdae]